MVGFTMNEIMTGTHQFADGSGPGGEFPLHFNLTWGNKKLLKFVNPSSGEFLHNKAKGFITVGGLVDKADCEGTLDLLYFSERKIRYDLNFTGDDQKKYRFLGEKRNILPWNIYKTHFTCYGQIMEKETGKLISESVVYFPYKQMLDFVASTRLVFNK